MKDRFLGSRREYGRSELVRNDLAPDPFSQFSQWYKDLLDSNPKDPNAVFLSTVSGDGQPSCRTMLLKEFTEDGFVFFTNYESRKGRDLRDNPKAAMLFFWPELERQVRVEGIVKELSAKDSELYFSQRPRGARIGAWASKQSSELSSRAR